MDRRSNRLSVESATNMCQRRPTLRLPRAWPAWLHTCLQTCLLQIRDWEYYIAASRRPVVRTDLALRRWCVAAAKSITAAGNSLPREFPLNELGMLLGVEERYFNVPLKYCFM